MPAAVRSLPRLLPRLLLLAALAAGGAPRAEAQDVLEMLRAQRRDARLAEIVREIVAARDGRLPLRPPHVLGEPDPFMVRHDAAVARRAFLRDSLAQAERDRLARLAPPVLEWVRVPADRQYSFLSRFGETFWRVASTYEALPMDTRPTLELRGRLTAVFGAPTRNAAAAAQERYSGSEHVQFEYWLVVNDSIPLLVLDTDGPFGRGLLVAGDERHEHLLPQLKAALSEKLLDVRAPLPYVDYYHSFEQRQWFRAGFDGEQYFTVPVRTPAWARNFAGERWMIHR
ncbi:MAG: hypothetical protein ACK41D_10875 [Rubricoccaceae bacterium]